jgi:hypothetical protein
LRTPRHTWARCAFAFLPLTLVSSCKDTRPVPIVVESTPSAPPRGRPARDSQPQRHAPARSPAGKAAGSDGQRFDEIRRGLRLLVAAEQGFFAENGVYTEDFDRLGFRPPSGTKFRFIWLNRDGWAVSGTHTALPGKDCVIFVGMTATAPTTLKFVRNAPEGVPVCDVPPISRRSGSAPAPVTRVADTASALEAVSPYIQMRVDLRNLVRSQDAYLATQGLYSRRFEPFALQYFWHRGVTIRILSADAESWAAKATHRTQPGKSCVVWFGPVPWRPTTVAQRRTPERSAVPVCDE